MTYLTAIDYLTDLEASASRLVKTPIPDDLVADVVGRCKHVEDTLATFRKALLSETDAPLTGKEYGLRSGGRKCDRSYSTVSIMSAFMDALDMSFTATLLWLKERDAVRLTWRWSELQQAFDKADLGIKIQKHEIVDDDDEWHVGEVWSEKPMQIVALEEPQ